MARSQPNEDQLDLGLTIQPLSKGRPHPTPPQRKRALLKFQQSNQTDKDNIAVPKQERFFLLHEGE